MGRQLILIIAAVLFLCSCTTRVSIPGNVDLESTSQGTIFVDYQDKDSKNGKQIEKSRVIYFRHIGSDIDLIFTEFIKQWGKDHGRNRN